MKVLWFTNTPSLAAKHINRVNIGGGWIESLEWHFGKSIGNELGIAFHYGYKNLDKRIINDTTYYLIPDLRNKYKRFIQKYRHVITQKTDVEFYLKVVEDFKPDIILIFGTENGFGLITPHLSIPVIIWIQGNLTVYHYKWFNNTTLTKVLVNSKIKDLILNSGLYHQYFVFKRAALREQLILAKTRYVIGRTDWDKRISSTLAPNSKYFHVDEVLRSEFYNIQWNYRKKSAITLISIMQGNIYKGIEVIFKTLKILSRFPDLNLSYRIIGISEDDEIVSLYKKNSGYYTIKERIVFKGRLDEESLIHELLDSDIYIHPSHIENSSNSICEAMIIGMPVIATFAGGTGSLIDDNKDGVLIQDGDPYALAGAIYELANNLKYAIQLGQNARKRALERHDPDRILKQLLDCFKNVLVYNTIN